MLFGYHVELFYDCGLKPIDSKEPPKSKMVFVSAVGFVFEQRLLRQPFLFNPQRTGLADSYLNYGT
jgi:hypothetical protein